VLYNEHNPGQIGNCLILRTLRQSFPNDFIGNPELHMQIPDKIIRGHAIKNFSKIKYLQNNLKIMLSVPVQTQVQRALTCQK
jgi:hypothetical protein